MHHRAGWISWLAAAEQAGMCYTLQDKWACHNRASWDAWFATGQAGKVCLPQQSKLGCLVYYRAGWISVLAAAEQARRLVCHRAGWRSTLAAAEQAKDALCATGQAGEVRLLQQCKPIG